ncbi:hypothetical protein [Mesorhizobium sp. M0767]|uniref:hypothetical protein n=1 Tax=Mesorhizobium sp. M0767 TaxID=2956995 RepID=UPI0033368521
MDSRKIAHIASNPATLMTFIHLALSQQMAAIMRHESEKGTTRLMLLGMAEMVKLQEEGRLHLYSAGYVQHCLQVISNLPEGYWVGKGLDDSADTLARCHVEGHA